MKPASRVIKNTALLYGKMLITIVISLYSTRLVLQALGVVDYGIFNLVSGVIAMLSFISTAMAISTQRYLSYFMGAGDEMKMKTIFNLSVVIHLAIGLLIVILLEIGGIFLFDGMLNIPAERIHTAKVIFHFMVISTFFTINAVPYDAVINAHENMLFDTLTGIFEVFMKLGIAIWVLYTKSDNLILYGLLVAALTILIRFIKSYYCLRKYDECKVRLRFNIDTHLLKEMFSFAGWNLYGTFCGVIRSQGLAVVLNLFYGVVINAAYGITNQVTSQVSAFPTNMIRALLPQIIKSEGGGDRERMLRLSTLACKLSFLLFAFFAIPLIIEMPFVLRAWLKSVPENTIIFCQLGLLLSMIQVLTIGLMAAVTSVGKIKMYQILMGTLLILNLPVAYILIKLGLPPYSFLIGSIVIEIFAVGLRIWLAHKIVGLKIGNFIRIVLINTFFSGGIALLAGLIPRLFIDEGLLRAGLSVVFSLLSLTLLAYLLVFTSVEKQKIIEIIRNFGKSQKMVINEEFD
jgi:O-antigen/teichoic acid export membrane protein